MAASPLTIAYLTSRKEPNIDWFFDSLHRECAGDYTGLRVVVIDFYAEAHKPGDGWTDADAQVRRIEFRNLCHCPDLVHSRPIWDTWQGPHRLTREHWFAKPNYLNAAVCLTAGDYLASVDDLSVLVPGWLQAVREAAAWPGITCGAYRKVRDLVVHDGVLVSFTPHPTGDDRRTGLPNAPVDCRGAWMYGCSFVAPVADILRVNGWPMLTNGMGYEDCVMGAVMEKTGTRFRYDRRMMTYESEEHHHLGKPMRREDYGASPNDKSHALLADGAHRTRWPNDFGGSGEDLAAIRAAVLSGAALPVVPRPRLEWFSNTPLADLK